MPVTGDNFTLERLAAATGDFSPDYSFSQVYGNSTANLDFEDFSIGSVGQVTLNTNTLGYGANVTATLGFTTVGRFFSKISLLSQNFQWLPGHTNSLTLQGTPNTTAVFRNNFAGCNETFTTHVFGAFNDQGFNNHAPGYAQNIQSPNITLYGPPKPSITSASAPDRPYNPLNTTGGCGTRGYGASITHQVTMGSHGGANGSNYEAFVTTNDGTAWRSLGMFSSSSFSTGRTLCGSTWYRFYIVNNFNCQSNQSLINTLSYP